MADVGSGNPLTSPPDLDIGHHAPQPISSPWNSPMKPGTALVLRLLGPMIELPCAVGLIRFWNRGVTWLGMPLESLFIAGLFVGLCMVLAGLTLVKRVQPARRPRLD